MSKKDDKPFRKRLMLDMNIIYFPALYLDTKQRSLIHLIDLEASEPAVDSASRPSTPILVPPPPPNPLAQQARSRLVTFRIPTSESSITYRVPI